MVSKINNASIHGIPSEAQHHNAEVTPQEPARHQATQPSGLLSGLTPQAKFKGISVKPQLKIPALAARIFNSKNAAPPAQNTPAAPKTTFASGLSVKPRLKIAALLQRSSATPPTPSHAAETPSSTSPTSTAQKTFKPTKAQAHGISVKPRLKIAGFMNRHPIKHGTTSDTHAMQKPKDISINTSLKNAPLTTPHLTEPTIADTQTAKPQAPVQPESPHREQSAGSPSVSRTEPKTKIPQTRHNTDKEKKPIGISVKPRLKFGSSPAHSKAHRQPSGTPPSASPTEHNDMNTTIQEMRRLAEEGTKQTLVTAENQQMLNLASSLANITKTVSSNIKGSSQGG